MSPTRSPPPQCNKLKKAGSKFCSKCKIILSFEGYQKIVDKQADRENEIKQLKEQIAKMSDKENELKQELINFKKFLNSLILWLKKNRLVKSL